MTLAFHSQPGAHERQLRRRAANPLFSASGNQVSQSELEAARKQDEAERQQFMETFRQLVEEIASLEGNVDSDAVLKLKERLDMTYERGCSIAGDTGELKQALRRLISVMMSTIRRHAASDPAALEKLDQEEAARRMHFSLLEQPLIADLLREDQIIPPAELLPVLLTEEPQALEAAITLFNPEQLGALAREGRGLLNRLAREGHDLPAAWERLTLLEAQAAPGTYQLGLN